MAKIRGIKRNFTGGEVARTIISRDDLAKYASSCSVMQNFIPQLHGLARYRNGTAFVGELPANPRIIPFVFNLQDEDKYVLCFSNNELRLAQGLGLVTAPGTSNPLVIASPYTTAQALELSHAQSGDFVYLAQRAQAQRRLARTSHTSWAFTTLEFKTNTPAPASLTGTWGGEAGTYTLEYAVCSVSAKGELSLPVKTTIANAKYTSDWVVGNYAQLNWPVATGVTEYNIYRYAGGSYGLIGTVTTNSFRDDNYEANNAKTIPVAYNPFKDGNYPSVVTMHQQRVWYAGGDKNPQTFYASQTGNFENFNKSNPLRNDDMLEHTVSSGLICQIQWMVPLRDLVIGTAGSEHSASGGGEGKAISPVDIYVNTESYWGSMALVPLIVGNSIVHVSRQGNRVADLFYDLASSGYKGNDLSVLAAHLFENHRIVSWCYQQSPDSLVWAVRDDGVLLSMTYLKEHQLWGWSRHITDGEVTQVCCLPGESRDTVYIVVKRKIGGVDKYYLEQMLPYWHASDGIENAVYLDCSVTHTFDTPQTVVTGLAHLEGKAVWVLGDGQPEGPHTVTGGKITLKNAASKVHVGLQYTGIVSPLTFEMDFNGQTTQAQERTNGKVILRLYESVGGAVSSDGVRYDDLAWSPEVWGEAIPPYTGDKETNPPGGNSAETSVWVKQEYPLPFNLLSIIAEVSIA